MEQNSANLSERELMMDMLNSQKQLMSLYSLDISESACPKLRNTLGSLFTDISNDQYKLWDLMNRKGYYPVDQAEKQKLDQAKQKAQQMKPTMN
jgi:spore coat protein F